MMEMRTQRPTRSGGATAVGVILVLAGLYYLVAMYFPVDLGRYGWPVLVVGTGVTLFAIGLLGRSVSGFVIPGTIVTAIGLILAVQNAFGLWATWSYVWALIPAAVGVGIVAQGMLRRDGNEIRAGGRVMTIGLVMFVVFGAFFEGMLHVSGYDLGVIGSVGIPLLLIAAGVILLVARPRSSRRPLPPPAPPLPG